MSDNITLPREVVELALDALDYGGFLKKQQSITALRTALAAPSEDIEALRRDAERYRWMTEDHPENETRRRVYSVTLLFNAHRKEHIDAAIDAAMGDKT